MSFQLMFVLGFFGSGLLLFISLTFYKSGYALGNSRGYEEGYRVCKKEILGIDYDEGIV